MFGMNELFASLEMLKKCLLLCFGVCLLFSLTPATDFDFDGEFDSFATDSLILSSVLSVVVLPAFCFGRFLSVRFVPPRPFSLPTVPPPEIY